MQVQAESQAKVSKSRAGAQLSAQEGQAPASEQISWVYINGLGEREETNVTESDVLTAITFNKSGEYLAVGDKGGRVIIFRYMDLKNSRYFDYRYFSEIQSHETEFDHLKSIELEEKINSLEFLHNTKESSLQLLSTNDRVIKFWKLDKRTHRETSKTQIVNG
jgi:serine/threonine-protein phosphatase 2A regulatory subunit B